MLSGTLSHYRIKESLGTGGMGEVYRVEDTRLGRDVALKVLRREFAEDRERLRRFRREAQLLAALDHPGIVTIFSIEEDRGVNFLTMQLIEGETLTQFIPDAGMNIGLFHEIATPLAEAVAAAHERGVIHRDLKPSNVMRTPEGRLKVLDFGLAKLSTGETQSESAPPTQDLSTDGLIIGTVPYMSPEQLSAEPLDERTDVFSLGVIFYEMITGGHPFAGSSPVSLISSILTKAPPDITRIRSDVPAELVSLIGDCLEKDRDRRIQTAREIYRRLRIGTKEISGVGSTPTGGLSSARRGEMAAGQSIAVLPFISMSTDPEDEFFADGVSEEIINALGRVPNLKVAARTSAFSFKGRNEDLRTIGEKLGVRRILEGSVRRAGNRLRITAQLVDAGNGYQLWTERYDREMADVFDIQEEISRKIASRLTETLITDSDPAVVHKGTTDVEAFKLYTQGRGLHEQRNETGLNRAAAFFRRAIERDRNYALAWSGLADALVLIEEYGFAELGSLIPEAREAIDRALELDPDLAEAHASHGLLHTHPGVRRGRIAIESLRRAVSINPNYAPAYHWESWMRLIVGHGKQALEAARKAVDLDPLSPEAASNVALALVAVGEPDKAIPAARRAAAIQNDFHAAILYEGAALYTLGRFQEVVERCTGLVVDWAPGGPECLVALAEVRLGNEARAAELVPRLAEVGAPVLEGFVHATAGREEEAIALFNRTVEWDYWPSIAFLSVFREDLGPLRQDPRYQDVVQRINEWWGMTRPAEEPTEVVG